MYNSKYYTCEQIDQRLLQGYYDDAVAAGYTGSKSQYLAGLLKAINYSANPTLTADKVVYNPAISGLTPKNVQGAIDELSDLAKSLKDNFLYKGIAQPTTNPGVPDIKVFYIAGEGSYPNFDNQVVEIGQIAVLKWDGSWHKETLEIGAGGGNMILDWNTDVATTRKQVLQKYRKPGMQISYKLNNAEWVTEQYTSIAIQDPYFEMNEYWVRIPNKIETENIAGIVRGEVNLLLNNKMIFSKGSFINKNNGLLASNSRALVSNFLKVKENDVLLYSGSHYGEAAGVAFYDENFGFIGYWSGEDNKLYTNERVTCIAKSAYARCTSFSVIGLSNLTYDGTEPTRIDKIESTASKALSGSISAKAASGILNLQYELENAWYTTDGKKQQGLYYANKDLLPIEEGWNIKIFNAVNSTDSASSLVFFDESKKFLSIVKYILTNDSIAAPKNAKYFAFTLKDQTGYVYLESQALIKHELEYSEFKEFKEKIETEGFEKTESDTLYGDIVNPKNDYKNYAQVYVERVKKDKFIRVKSVKFGIGQKVETPLESQGVYLYKAIQLLDKKLQIVEGGRFFQKELTENSVNSVEVDFPLFPNEILVAIISGGILTWGGTESTGLSGYNGKGPLRVYTGETIDTTLYLTTEKDTPTSKKGGFLSYTYDTYESSNVISNSLGNSETKTVSQKAITDAINNSATYNFLNGKKIGVIGDSESVSSFSNVTWAKEEQDRAEYSAFYKSSGHWSKMICERVGAILNNRGISGSVVFGDPSDQQSAMKQLENLDKDIDYLIVFTGTNGARLRDKNKVNITTLGDETSPKLSAMPTLIDSNDETFTICGALKWMIEYMYKLFPNTKIGFITPWAYQIRNDIDGSYILDRSRVEGGDFAKAIRMICPLYSIPYFDNVKDSNICWFNDDQRHALMGQLEIVPTISQVKNFKIGPNMQFYVKDENAVYKVLTSDSNHIPQSWEKVKENSSGTAYGDGLHISNSNGHRYLSYKYENFIKSI